MQKLMAFGPDALGYELCFFLSMFCYFSLERGTVIQESNDEDVHRIFPNLSAKDAKYASTIITMFMRTLVGKVQGLHKDTTSKDLRYGSMDNICSS